jgi:hypothetical protein
MNRVPVLALYRLWNGWIQRAFAVFKGVRFIAGTAFNMHNVGCNAISSTVKWQSCVV